MQLANVDYALRKRWWMVSSKGPEALAEEEPLSTEDKIMFVAVERYVVYRQT